MVARDRLWRTAAALCGALGIALAVAGCDRPASTGRWSFSGEDHGEDDRSHACRGLDNVYVGSWDGFEYAFDQATGEQKWRTDLGKYVHPDCGQVGVTSSPAVIDTNLYLGGGFDRWYALNTAGAIQWSIFTGDPNQGFYNWSTPVVYNGYAYVGIASLCDTPLVQGRLLRVNLATHQVVNTWKVVPDGQVGGTIWTKPAVDAARNTIYLTTGNRAYDSTGNNQQYAEALVALDATTLAIKGSWSLPLADPTPDADWAPGRPSRRLAGPRRRHRGQQERGRVRVPARQRVRRPDLVPARRRARPRSGPRRRRSLLQWVLRRQAHLLRGRADVDRRRAGRRLDSALDPRTGGLYWQKALPTKTYGALTAANGMLVVPSRNALRVLDPVTGEILYANELGLYAAARYANGRLFIGDVPGVVRAYTFPASPGQGAAQRPPPPRRRAAGRPRRATPARCALQKDVSASTWSAPCRMPRRSGSHARGRCTARSQPLNSTPAMTAEDNPSRRGPCAPRH